MVAHLNEWLKSDVPSLITNLQINRTNGRYVTDADGWKLVGNEIRFVRRRGKYICFDLKEGYLTCHNAMSGFWDTQEKPWTFNYVEGKRTATSRNVRVEIRIQNHQTINLRFHDARLFGSLRFSEDPSQQLRDLGPDALDTPYCRTTNIWTPGNLYSSCQTYAKSIKELLMDQHSVAGIGNIYSVEGLSRALVNPFRLASSLSRAESAAVYEGARCSMIESIDSGIDYSMLRVYRVKFCWRCGTQISKEKLAGRSTYFCSKCQV